MRLASGLAALILARSQIPSQPPIPRRLLRTEPTRPT